MKLQVKSIFRSTTGFMMQLMISFVVVILLNSGVFALSGVVGPSMESTLQDSERLIIDKVSYKFNLPERGDIVVFLNDETIDGFTDSIKNHLQDMSMKLKGEVRRNRLVKRVIGLPGDSINITNNQVYVNEVLIEEPYVKGVTYTKYITYPLTVPEGKVFVLGDNRENSNDSRSFGSIDVDSIEGRVMLRYWPLNQAKKW